MLMEKKILHFGPNEELPDCYDIVITVDGQNLDPIKEKLINREFKITEYKGHVTAVFTGEWEPIVKQLRFLEREGWLL